MDVMHGSSP
jgi:hypothetical protein